MKEHQDRYVVVAEKCTLDGANTITLMKHNHTQGRIRPLTVGGFGAMSVKFGSQVS